MLFDFQQKKKMREFFYSPIVVVLALLIALYALYSTWSIYRKLLQTRHDAELVQAQVLTLEARNQKLDTNIQDLQTQSGVEKEIRTKFGVAKPGEQEAVIYDDASSTSGATNKTSWWQKFIGFFGF